MSFIVWQTLVNGARCGELQALSGRFPGVLWRWWGGEYCELGPQGGELETGAWSPVAVVNLWDYETGARRIPFTVAAFAEHLEQLYSCDNEAAAVLEQLSQG